MNIYLPKGLIRVHRYLYKNLPRIRHVFTLISKVIEHKCNSKENDILVTVNNPSIQAYSLKVLKIPKVFELPT